jgi:SAM-dependent methyltransferase
VCNGEVRRFVPLSPDLVEPLTEHGWPFGLSQSETINPDEYSCPHCQTSDRERMYALWIRRNARGGGRLLDVGPTVALNRFLRSRFDVTSVDLEDQVADERADLQALPYPDESFDAFVCSHVLEHIPDDRAGMRELRRVLRPAGWGILMVPIVLTIDAIDEAPDGVSEAEAWRRFGQNDHVRLYNRDGFLARAREAGFAISEHRFGVIDRYRHAIRRGSVLYTVTRSLGHSVAGSAVTA